MCVYATAEEHRPRDEQRHGQFPLRDSGRDVHVRLSAVPAQPAPATDTDTDTASAVDNWSHDDRSSSVLRLDDEFHLKPHGPRALVSTALCSGAAVEWAGSAKSRGRRAQASPRDGLMSTPLTKWIYLPKQASPDIMGNGTIHRVTMT